VNYLITIASKLSMGTANLNVILGSQHCVFEKAGIGYQTRFQRKQKKYSSFSKTDAQQFLLTCFYCMREGHPVKNYKIRKFDLPKGLVRWVPKRTSNTVRPKFNWVLKPQI